MLPEDSQDEHRLTLLTLWGKSNLVPFVFFPSSTVQRDKYIALCDLHFEHCFPHPTKMQESVPVSLCIFLPQLNDLSCSR